MFLRGVGLCSSLCKDLWTRPKRVSDKEQQKYFYAISGVYLSKVELSSLTVEYCTFAWPYYPHGGERTKKPLSWASLFTLILNRRSHLIFRKLHSLRAYNRWRSFSIYYTKYLLSGCAKTSRIRSRGTGPRFVSESIRFFSAVIETFYFSVIGACMYPARRYRCILLWSPFSCKLFFSK